MKTDLQQAWDAWEHSDENPRMYDASFDRGVQWTLVGLAVCEFLADLAVLVNRCPDCLGKGYAPDGMGSLDGLAACDRCEGTGKKHRAPPPCVCNGTGVFPGNYTCIHCNQGKVNP